MKTYQYVDHARTVISTISTLGHKVCARDSKVAIIKPIKLNKDSESKNFAWPYKLKNNGPFWTSKISQHSINILLNKVDSYNNSDWKKIKDKYLKKSIIYDPNNKTYVNLVKKTIK